MLLIATFLDVEQRSTLSEEEKKEKEEWTS